MNPPNLLYSVFGMSQFRGILENIAGCYHQVNVDWEEGKNPRRLGNFQKKRFNGLTVPHGWGGLRIMVEGGRHLTWWQTREERGKSESKNPL